MRQSKIAQALMRRVYCTEIGRRLVRRYGPAVWRLPRDFRRRLCYEADLRRIPGVRSWKYGEAESVMPVVPWPAKEAPTFGHFLAARPHHLKPAAVYELPQAWLVGKHAAAVTDRGRLLLTAFANSARILGLEANDDLARWLATRSWRQNPPGGAWTHLCSLVSRLDPNYYHWTIDGCAQLEALEHYERQTGIQPRALIRADGPAYQRESLELLGFAPERILQWRPADGPQWVRQLVVPALSGTDIIRSPASMRWLRERFLRAAHVDSADPQAAQRRVYIPRKPGGWRAVANDEQVIARLRQEGFEIAAPETMTMAEQIRFFSQARLIVGLHGAALTNLLFAPHAALIELTSDYGGGEYYSLACTFGQSYAALRCPSVNNNDDIKVDVEALAKLLT
jgi:capsular polysaccharide biosynthesis protein